MKEPPAVRQKAFEVVRNSKVSYPLFPYFPEDLAPLHVKGNPANRLDKHIRAALSRYSSHFKKQPGDDLEMAVAITDWVAATMLHPSFYPSFDSPDKIYAPTPHPFFMTNPSAVEQLEFVLKFDPADAKNWPSPFCDHQNTVAAAMLNYLGIHAQKVNVSDHSGLQFYSRQLHKWIWCEATFNEHYILEEPDGSIVPLGVKDLHRLTVSGDLDQVRVVKHGYPTVTYLDIQPDGFKRYMTFNVTWPFTKAGHPEDIPVWVMVSDGPPLKRADEKWSPLAQVPFIIPSAWLDAPTCHDPELNDTELDALGLIGPIRHLDDGVEFSLRSLLPFTEFFEMSSSMNNRWIPFQHKGRPTALPTDSTPIHLTWPAGTVRIRAVDTVGNRTQEFIIALSD